MKNYFKVAEKIDIDQLSLEVKNHPELWNQSLSPWRASTGPHAQADSIWMRARDEAPFKERGNYSGFNDEHHPIWYPEGYALMSARPLIHDLMRSVQGESLGYVFIYRLKPGAEIVRHVDDSWHCRYHDKFNICLQSNPQAAFKYDDEEMIAEAGDVHWFRNDIPHAVINHGVTDHIIMHVSIHIDRRNLCQPHG